MNDLRQPGISVRATLCLMAIGEPGRAALSTSVLLTAPDPLREAATNALKWFDRTVEP